GPLVVALGPHVVALGSPVVPVCRVPRLVRVPLGGVDVAPPVRPCLVRPCLVRPCLIRVVDTGRGGRRGRCGRLLARRGHPRQVDGSGGPCATDGGQHRTGRHDGDRRQST